MIISWWSGEFKNKKQLSSSRSSSLAYISFSTIICSMDCRKSAYGSSESFTTAMLSFILPDPMAGHPADGPAASEQLGDMLVAVVVVGVAVGVKLSDGLHE